jgi:carbon storage regulator
MIGDDVEVTVLGVTGEKVRLGISAPGDVPVFRREVFARIAAERADRNGGAPEADELPDRAADAADRPTAGDRL